MDPNLYDASMGPSLSDDIIGVIPTITKQDAAMLGHEYQQERACGSIYWKVPNMVETKLDTVSINLIVYKSLFHSFDFVEFVQFLHRPKELVQSCRIETDTSDLPTKFVIQTTNPSFLLERIHNYISINGR